MRPEIRCETGLNIMDELPTVELGKIESTLKRERKFILRFGLVGSVLGGASLAVIMGHVNSPIYQNFGDIIHPSLVLTIGIGAFGLGFVAWEARIRTKLNVIRDIRIKRT